MKRSSKWRRRSKAAIAMLLALFLAFEGTEPLIVSAQEIVESMPREVDFSQPEALESLEEAGVQTNQDTQDAQATQETGADDVTAADNDSEESDNPSQTSVQETDDTSESDTQAAYREPQDYYPLPEEPEGQLVAFDEESRTYKTGEKEYTTVFGGYVGTYQDADGQMQLVDNTLEEQTVKPAASVMSRVRALFLGEETTPVYTNKANDYSIRLPKQITQEAGIVIEKDGVTIEIVPLQGDYSRGVAKDNAVLYNDVYAGVDVQYTVLDANIKEDIVLYQKTEPMSFSYELRIPGLQAECKDNQVYLYPEEGTIDDAVYILEAPSMEDAAGEVSFQIVLSLQQDEEEGSTVLTVTPDAQWLADPARQYPIRIDPSTVNIDKQAFSLIGVEEGSPNTTIGDNNYPYVGFDDGIRSGNLKNYGTAHQNCRTYIKVNSDFSAIPKDAKIDGAVFGISQRTAYSGGGSQFGLYRVDQPWSTSITWKTKPLWQTFVDVRNASPTRDSYIYYNVKDLVNDWVQGTYANYGMALIAIAEANNLGAAMQCEVMNNRNSPYGPFLAVVWSPAEDPYLRDMSLDDTTVTLRPMTEKSLNGKLQFDAVFADGIAKSQSLVEYYLLPDEAEQQTHHLTDAKPLYTYPDSTAYNQMFPEANKYYSKDSNWQSELYTGLTKDKLYSIHARAYKELDGTWQAGQEATSDSFVIYEVKQFDTFPKIAQYYGVPLANIMKDNQVQDALVVSGNTIFIRNPQTNVPYNPAPLTDLDRMRIDGALMGRGLHCEFGFEPVNLNTGNFYMDETDASMKELNGTFSVVRSYNSKGTDQNSVFGRGWSFNYSQSLSQMEDGSIVYLRGDGSYLFFTPNADGSYSAPEGYCYTLRRVTYQNTDHDYIGWEITDADGSIWSFDVYGMLRFVTDAKGFVTTIVYDDSYHMTKIITPSGKVFGITQNGSGYITALTLPDGTTRFYGYDANGNLVSATDGNGKKRTYIYDANNRMVSWKDENGNTVVTNTYDAAGRVIKQTDANGATATFTYAKGSTTTVDNEGNKTVYQYDDQYRTTGIIYPDGTKCIRSYNANNQLATETTANGTKRYTYDRFGNVASEIREDGAKATYVYNDRNQLTSVTGYAGTSVHYAYDGAGNLISCTQPDGSRVTYGYDAWHRMISQTDGNGVTTTYGYDGANMTSCRDGEGQLWTYGYDAMNRLVSVRNPLGNTTTVTYDKNGRVIRQKAADGGVTSYALDGVGNVLSTTDALGNTTTFAYDKMYNIIQTTDPLGNKETYAYNKNNEQIKATDALGNTITYQRDSMGRVVEENNADFGTKRYIYDGAGNLIKYLDGEGNATTASYDTQGNITKMTDALGNETTYTYDALGRQTGICYADGSSTKTSYDVCGRVKEQTDAMGGIIRYTYDANGNILSISDQGGRTYTYRYDRNNNRTTETNPEGGSCYYTYDAAGRKISYTNELGQKETYTYDGCGRLLGRTDALGQKETYTYDALGNQITMTDAAGNVTKMTYDGRGSLTSVTDAQGNITAMKYDGCGNLIETIDALKGTTSYVYDSQGNITKVTDALGNVYVATYDKNGSQTMVSGPQGAKTTMTYDALGQLRTAKDAQGLAITYAYDAMGRLVRQADNAGNVSDYVYDALGNVTAVTDAIGRTTSYTYDDNQRLTRITKADGSQTTYTYDVMDRITSVTDAQGVCTTFAYDALGNQIAMQQADDACYQYGFDAKNRMVLATDPQGATKTWTYDALGNVIAATDENGITTRYQYDKNNNVTAITDGNGNTTAYGYDALDRLIMQTSPLGEVQEYRYDALGNLTKYKDAVGNITEYCYDALGNMIEEIDPKGGSTRYTYDWHGNVLSREDALGNQTTYEVNRNDQVTKMVQPNEGTYTYVYDEAGRLAEITTPLGFATSFVYNLGDCVIEESNSLGQTTTYAYDKLGRMIGSVDAKGGETSYSYDIRGNMTGMTDALGNTTQYTYDTLSRMIQTKDPLGNITTYTYDPVGNVTGMVKPGGRQTTYTYDGNYNLTGITDPLGNTTTYAYDASNRLTGVTDALKQTQTYAYDGNGRLITETDAAGESTSYTYDPNGNVLTATDAAGLVTHYSYDANDNLIRVTDAAGGMTTYAYDAMDQVCSVVSADGKETTYTYDLEGNLTQRTDAVGRTKQWDYDEAGRLTTEIAPSGKKICYDYDELNQLVQKSYENARGKQIEADVLYGYDANGQRVSMEDAIGEASYERDALGRITKAVDSAGKTVTYAYDENGNIAEIGYPDGTKVTYAYDLNDNLIQVTDRQGEVTEYTYDALDRVVRTTRANGLITDITYDALDHITGLVTFCSGCGEIVSRYQYTYNAAGYVTEETEETSTLSYDVYHALRCKSHFGRCDHFKEHSHTSKKKCSCMTTTTRSYTYDENWQLTKCAEVTDNKIKTTYAYSYDGDGNRIRYTKTSQGRVQESYSYRYNDANQLIAKTDERKHCGGTTHYCYDEDGNLRMAYNWWDLKETRCYDYTAEDHLRAVTGGREVLMAALYDGDGNRLFTLDYEKTGVKYGVLIPPCKNRKQKTSEAVCDLAGLAPRFERSHYTITEYVNDINCDNAQTLMEMGLDGRAYTAYTYGNERISKDTFCGSIYYLYDGRGSVTGEATTSGMVTRAYRYDPYGQLIYGQPTTTNYYGYNGESTNANTGLQYLRARYYNPQNGNFLTEDTYAGSLTQPLTQNRYDYVSNNPLNYTDPSGHSWLSRIGNGLKSAANAVVQTGKKIANAVKEEFNNELQWIKYVLDHPQQTTQQVQQIADKKSKEVKETFQQGFENVNSSFQTYASKKTQEIRETIQREMCGEQNQKLQLPEVDLKYTGTPTDAFGMGIGAGLLSIGIYLAIAGGESFVLSGGLAAPVAGAVEVIAGAFVIVGGVISVIEGNRMFEIQVSQSTSGSKQPENNPEDEQKPNQGQSGSSNKPDGSPSGGSAEAGESGSNFRNQDLLDSHYDKHGSEFGNISKEQYLQGANDLINSTSDDILTKTRANGDTIHYNPYTNEFAVKSADGYIRTYFKPSDGLEYFIRQ